MDEPDKAPKAVKDAAGNSLQGDVLISTEDLDEDVEIVPVVLVTSNATPTTFLLEYRRRSIVFDTRAIEDDLPVNRSGPARAFLAALPRWNIDQLVPPDWPLDPILDAVNTTIIPGLKADGQRLDDEGTLALLVLGRAAWTGLGLEHAVQAVVADYLDTADTVDETLRPVATKLALPEAFARRLADEHRARDEADRRRQVRLRTLALEARKGSCWPTLTSSRRRSLHRAQDDQAPRHPTVHVIAARHQSRCRLSSVDLPGHATGLPGLNLAGRWLRLRAPAGEGVLEGTGGFPRSGDWGEERGTHKSSRSTADGVSPPSQSLAYSGQVLCELQKLL
jgi:hypothetical protein